MIKKLIALLVILAALGGAGWYVWSKMESRSRELPGDVYDYRRDKELVQTVQLALSLHAVMSRLTAGDEKRGRPQVRYAIDSVTEVGPDVVEVRYRLYFQYPTSSEQAEYTKRFRRKRDGTWSVLR